MPALMEQQGVAWQEDNFDWLETIAQIAHKLGISILMQIILDIDFANNSRNRLYISQQEFPLGAKASYQNKENNPLMYIFRVETARQLKMYLKLDITLARKVAKDIIDFESMLAEGMADERDDLNMNEMYKASTLEEAQAEYAPHMDLRKQATTILDTLPPNIEVYAMHGYLEQLFKTISKVPKSTVANYIFFQMLSRFIVDLDEREAKRQDDCLYNMKKYFYKHLDNMFYHHEISNDTAEPIAEMWQLLKDSFQTSLQQINWIQEGTRQKSIQKLQAMNQDILNYEEYNLTKTYANLNLLDNDYLGNVRQMLELGAASERAKVNEPPQVKKTASELSTSPAYMKLENAIKIPVVFLQPHTTFSKHFPNAYNFGTMGSVLAHELVHGFDKDGQYFDLKGNNRLWWDAESSAEFETHTKCLRDQYRGFIYEGQPLGDIPNQAENIADNGGIRTAYLAYLKWSVEAAAENDQHKLKLKTLPGLSYNNRQLFFIGYGHLWCKETLKAFKTSFAAMDTHVPSKFRVNGPLANLEEFSTEFKCPEGSNMNPVKKCKIY
uniref:Peptidase M13 C-terminal domain-containing protein n=1 Tax=Stomoxys calcitrans TaxID=35570 RepID=A0A1I8NWK9_STOCA